MSDLLARLDPEIRPAVERAEPTQLDDDVVEVRRARADAIAASRASWPVMPEVTAADHVAPGLDRNPDVRVRVYQRADRAAPTPVFVWLHGGGWIYGGIDDDDLLCRYWAKEHGCVVV